MRAPWIAAAIMCAATAAAAQPSQPSLTAQQLADRDAHVATAASYYELGNFEGAIAEYRAAYAIDPQPDYVFAMAMIEQQRGGCAEAVRLADEFLATRPPAADVEVIEQAMADCRAKVAPPVVDASPPLVDDAPPAPPPTRTVARAFYTDVVADAVVGLGVVASAGAVALYVRARGQLDDAEAPGLTDDEYQARWDEARSTRLYASIAGSLGLTLIAGGVYRWITGDRTEQVPVGVEPTRGGAQVSAAWRF